jgi:hypothetical protein
MLAMPEPLRPPMLIVQNDLNEMNMELLKTVVPAKAGRTTAARSARIHSQEQRTPGKQTLFQKLSLPSLLILSPSTPSL